MKIQKAITDAALTAICLMLVIPIIVYTFPFILGAGSSYTVMSGSMSPALSPGDLIIVKVEEPIDIGDMVTVESGEFTYTHRVVEKPDGSRFRLKGDANEEPDLSLIEASKIVGKVVLVFPFGHLYTPYGFALALLAPAALIIGKQVHTVYQFTKRRNKRETMRWRRKSRRSAMLGTGTLLLTLILTMSTTRVIAPHFLGGSSSFFSDVEWGTGFFRAGIWHVDVLVDIDPDTLNLNNSGEWITVYIETGYERDIVLSSVTLDGSIPAVTDPQYGFVTNFTSLMVKFDRESVISHVEGRGDYVTLTLSGLFADGVRFTGEDTIQVIP